MPNQKSISYSSAGVNYEIMDPVKKLAQEKAKETAKNLEPFSEVANSRGESAYVWDEGDSYKAIVIEGLGTKSLVVDKMYEITGKSYYDVVAQDTVAAIINDLVVVGAKPLVLNAYWALGKSDWLSDEGRTKDLVEGWAKACMDAGVAWGGGETPTNTGIINSETIDLAGSAVGIVSPKERLTLGEKLTAGDKILLIESNGIHANGLTLVRKIAEGLDEGYKTALEDGQSFGESLLRPSYIYAKLVQSLFGQDIDIHYMVNITGHGFRKLMRVNKDFTYSIEEVPPVDPLFKFIQEKSGNSDEEMYGNFNMGAGFAVFLPESDVKKAQEIAEENGFKSWVAGEVLEGEKQVVIKPLNITFSSSSLGVR